ncbi:hypothetical protein B0H13DRAFT_2277537 [Mycena leptocephala]|nr:hypothetical protein B0H13DRAFT_2277537 [Mycena leptocephala]
MHIPSLMLAALSCLELVAAVPPLINSYNTKNIQAKAPTSGRSSLIRIRGANATGICSSASTKTPSGPGTPSFEVKWHTINRSELLVLYDGPFGQRLNSFQAAYQALSHKSQYPQAQADEKASLRRAVPSRSKPKPIRLIAWLNKVYQI